MSTSSLDSAPKGRTIWSLLVSRDHPKPNFYMVCQIMKRTKSPLNFEAGLRAKDETGSGYIFC